MIQSICSQLIGASITPNWLSGRCVFIFLLLNSLIIMNSYTSTLVSNLVKSNSKNKIKTIKDLENSQLKIGFEEIPYIHSFLNVCDSLFLTVRTWILFTKWIRLQKYTCWLSVDKQYLSVYFISEDTLILKSIKCSIIICKSVNARCWTAILYHKKSQFEW